MADTTKKLLEDDFTDAEQAVTKADVDAQDARTRLWQSLNYQYNRQKENSDLSYDKAVSQADRSALARGMQRSSYNQQAQANLLNQKVKAQNDIDSALIADYQNRIGEIEQQEQENEWKQKQFDENQRQFNENLAFQQSEADRSQSNFEIQQAFNEKQWKAQQEQWKQEFNYTKMSDAQKIAYQTIVTAASNGKNVSDAILKKVGISRKDYNAMKAKAKSSGVGTKKNMTPATTNPNATTTGNGKDTAQNLINDMTGNNGNQKDSVTGKTVAKKVTGLASKLATKAAATSGTNTLKRIK